MKITIGELPPRARPLDAQEYADVFGGCSGHHGPCQKDGDCCQDMYCDKRYVFPNPAGGLTYQCLYGSR